MRARVRGGGRRATASCAVVLSVITGCSGAADRDPVVDPDGVVDLAIGTAQVCTLDRDREVACGDADRRAPIHGTRGALEIAAGHDHACARLDSGRVACWGANDFGQLGDATTIAHASAVEVRGLSGAKAIAAGHARTCAVTEDGSVWCWGAGELDPHRMLVEPRIAASPTRIEGLDDATAIAVGGFHVCALRAGGRVTCWGSNDLGQLGDGTRTSRDAPRTIDGLDSVVAIGAGWLHTCALRDDGAVLCWGADLVGQMGPSDTPGTAKTSPTRIAKLPKARAIAVAGEHTCAIPEDGSAPRCWGYDGEGQITGRASGIVRTPRRLDVGAFTRVAAGASRTCALLERGALQCLGAVAEAQGPT